MNKMNFVWQYLGKTLLEFKVMLLGYRVYRVRLEQTGALAPVATELENTLNVKATYSYDAVGRYSVVFSRDIFSGATFDSDVNIGNNFMIDTVGSFSASIQAHAVSATTLNIESFKGTAVQDGIIGQIVDSLSNPLPNVLEVRVYNK